MKRIMAKVIMAIYAIVLAGSLGRAIRGPLAGGVGRDVLTGGSVMGGIALVQWAWSELADAPEAASEVK